MLDDGESHSEKVGFLKSALSDELLVNLAGDGDERNAVHVCVGYEVTKLVAPGPMSPCTRRLCRLPGHNRGHEPAALFLTGQDGSDLFGLGQGLVQFHGCSARVGEHHLHALALKGVDEYVCPFHGGTKLAFCFGIGLGNGLRIHDDLWFEPFKMPKNLLFFKGKGKDEGMGHSRPCRSLVPQLPFSCQGFSLSPSDPEDIEN